MGYTITDDLWDALEEQPKTVQNIVLGAAVRLFFTGEEDNLTGIARGIFAAFRPKVVRARVNSLNRKNETQTKSKRNANEFETKSKRIANEIETKSKRNRNELAKEEKGKEKKERSKERKEKGKEENPSLFADESAILDGCENAGTSDSRTDGNADDEPAVLYAAYAEVIGYLNEKAGTRFRQTSEATRRLIRARIADGYTVDDFKRVIDNKVATWGNDPRMTNYLRPETLFRASKFEGYLNERPVTKGVIVDAELASYGI